MGGKGLGLGIWDLGLGTWDLGLGTWDLGLLARTELILISVLVGLRGHSLTYSPISLPRVGLFLISYTHGC